LICLAHKTLREEQLVNHAGNRVQPEANLERAEKKGGGKILKELNTLSEQRKDKWLKGGRGGSNTGRGEEHLSASSRGRVPLTLLSVSS